MSSGGGWGDNIWGYEPSAEYEAKVLRCLRDAEAGVRETLGGMTEREVRGMRALLERNSRKKPRGVKADSSIRKVTCDGCGCGLNEFTRGCRACQQRRRVRERARGVGARHFVCKGCGGPTAEIREGCTVCKQRAYAREYKARVTA